MAGDKIQKLPEQVQECLVISVFFTFFEDSFILNGKIAAYEKHHFGCIFYLSCSFVGLSSFGVLKVTQSEFSENAPKLLNVVQEKK